MAEEKKVVTLDDFEQRLMVSGLMDFRNDLLRDEKPTEDINDLILKVIDTPQSAEALQQGFCISALLAIQHRRFLSQRLLRRSFWREQYRVVLLPNHRLRQDTSSKPGRAYTQPTHKSCSYRNAVLICSTKSPYFLEILRNLLTNQSVVLYHMNTTEVSSL